MKKALSNSISAKFIVFAMIMFCSQAFTQQLPRITQLNESEANVSLDGFVDEPVWQSIPIVDGMKIVEPDTLEDAPYKTDIRFFYTESGIYFGIINHQPAETIISRLIARDTPPFNIVTDSIGVVIDASGEGRYGYGMRLSLGDSQFDFSLLPELQVNPQWDGAWDGRTQVVDEGWSAEFFMPWSVMPLPQADGDRKIGLAFSRDLAQEGVRWGSPPLPMTRNVFLSGFQKYELSDIEPSRQLTVYPFVSSVFDGIRHDANSRVGADIYWRPTTNTLLSSTLNPDFGTVESDDVVVNLTAFEVFFPERRVFFQEGQEIFNTSPRSGRSRFRGPPGGPVSLLNTRRIGGASKFDVPDGVNVRPTDLSQPTELLGAVKFTGQNGNLRYGTLLASEDDPEIQGTLSDGTRVDLQATGRDFAVGRFLYEDTSGGSRRSIGWMGTDVSHPDINAQVNAIDAHYFSADQRWALDGQFMHSDVDGVTGSGFLGDVSYIPRQGTQHILRATYIDDEFDMNDLGFLARNSEKSLDYNFVRTESDIPGLQSRTTTFGLINRYNTDDGRPVALARFLGRTWNYLNNNTFDISFRDAPSKVDDRLGRGTGDFSVPNRFNLSTTFSSNPANALAWSINLNAGQDDLGPQAITTGAGVVWRPNDRFSFDLSLSYTDQEALLVHKGDGNYTSFEAHQWAPKLDSNYFISARQQFRVTLQWNSLKAFEDRFWQVNPNRVERLKPVANPDNESDDFVISRMTFQARYRWQIAPLSDLFIVYTRGSNLPSNSFYTFQDLLEQGWNDRIVDSFAIKLRYRFGV